MDERHLNTERNRCKVLTVLACVSEGGICRVVTKSALYMGPNNLCYVARHFLFFPYVAMSLFIRP